MDYNALKYYCVTWVLYILTSEMVDLVVKILESEVLPCMNSCCKQAYCGCQWERVDFHKVVSPPWQLRAAESDLGTGMDDAFDSGSEKGCILVPEIAMKMRHRKLH